MLDEGTAFGTAVVIGAGTMGGGIAALLANAGWDVRLLDVPGQPPAARSAAAVAGLARVAGAKPPQFALPEFAGGIRVGNTEDDIAWLAEADWVVEAAAERMAVKQEVMALVERSASPAAVVSTNTSGLSLREITADRSDAFRRRFLGTHFFNPPRQLRLLELIELPETDRTLAEGFTAFAKRWLGRRVVRARDTPGFISNRIGMWTLLDSIAIAEEMGLTVEEADTVSGPLIGRPASALFRLADLIGFDVLADIASTQRDRLPHDPMRDRLKLPTVLSRLIADGRLGEKSGAGFYKREGKEILALDFTTLDYRPRKDVSIPEIQQLSRLPLPERIRALRQQGDLPAAKFVSRSLDSLIRYVQNVGPEIAGDTLAIDRVMEWGFNWQAGPFALADMVGAPESSFREEDGRAIYRVFGGGWAEIPVDPRSLSLAKVKSDGGIVLDSPETSLVDIGDGVACLEFHTKMNTLTPGMVDFIGKSAERAEQSFLGLVIGSEAPNFSAGFDLKSFLAAAESAEWSHIDEMVAALQSVCLQIKYARIPVVAAVQGYTLGGGCELVLHCAAVQASRELAMGLPEVAVGLVPAGGGTKESLVRAMIGAETDAVRMARAHVAFDRITGAQPTRSADEAKKLGWLMPADRISANSDWLLSDAKALAVEMANAGYRPRVRDSVRVLGPALRASLRMKIHWMRSAGDISDFDRDLYERVAYILSGGNLPFAQDVSEEYLLRLEREMFVQLVKDPRSVARMRHMLETGKRLAN